MMLFLFFQSYKLIDLNQADFNLYLIYTRHPLFQELVPAVHLVVDKFYKEFKDYKPPTQSFMLAGLAARARDARSFPAKRGTSSFHTFRIFRKAVCLIIADASTAPTGPRAEKAKKNKNSVRFLIYRLRILIYFIYFQVKRSVISKEIVDDANEEVMPPLPSETISFENPDDATKSSDAHSTNSSMDVDPSPSFAKTVLEPIPESTPVVCLPYSLVPGLDITSQSYQKAVITLGKQQNTSVTTTERVPLISILDRGTIPLHLISSFYF